MKEQKDLSIIELEGKKKSIMLVQAGITSLGTISGWVYANRTGGGFWRYVGFGFIGATIAVVTSHFITSQKINKIQTEIDLKKSAQDVKRDAAGNIIGSADAAGYVYTGAADWILDTKK